MNMISKHITNQTKFLMTKFLFFGKRDIRKFGLLGLMFLFYTAVQAQVRVSGTVTDQNGPAPGVNVAVDGTNINVATGADGTYTLAEVPSDATLVFSSIGYETQRIEVNGQSTINVVLVENLQALDEVVVVGYGTQNRATVTGAMSNVKSEEIAAVPVANPAEALQGRAAGVQVINTGGPGSEPSVSIRGLGSFNNNAPLYVVDGVIVGNLSGISQNDIESINILKDASTTAVYGAKGANGVVMVTTKRGVKGQTQLSVNAFAGFQTQPKRYDVLNTEQYLQYAKDAFGLTPTSELSQSGINTNWQDEIYQVGRLQNYDVAVAGGGETNTFRFSAGYAEKEGIIINTGFERFTFRSNSDFEFGKLKVGQTMSANFNKLKPEADAGGRSLLEHAIKMAPYLPVYNAENPGGFQGPNSSADAGNDAENPVRIMRLTDRNNRSFSLIGNVYAQYEFIEGLNFRTEVGLDYYNSNNSTFTPSFADGPTHQQPYAAINKSAAFSQNLIFTNSLTYDKTFGDAHNLEVLLLSEKISSKFNDLNANSRNPISNEINNIQGSDEQISAATGNNEYNKIGYLGRLNYDYDNKYLVSASLRRDGSSRFGANRRWGWFYSGSLGWNIAREAFMEGSDFSTLKIRGSYGVSGNDNIANYVYAALLTSDFLYPIGGVGAAGTTADGLANPDLKWEQTKQLNVGLDVGLFNERFTAALEYYMNTSDGLLLNVPLPNSLGVNSGSQTRNVGSIEVSGFEVSLGYNDYEGDFKWSANLNLGTAKNTAKSLGGTVTELQGGGFEGENITRIIEGKPLYHYVGYVMDGIYQNQAEVDAVFWGNPSQTTVQPGDIRYKDLNGDGNITNADKTIIGDALPDFTYGLNFTATYRNWDFNAFFMGIQGRDLINTNIYDLEAMPRLFNAGVGVLDRWTPTNPSNSVPRAGIGGGPDSGAPQNAAISTRYLEDGSFMRLKNLSIGYTLPGNLFGQDYLKNCRIYVSGQNVFTISSYSGLDPEIANSDPFFSGVDRGAFPQPRTYLIGLTANF